MKKFTVFTIILTLVVVVVFSEMFAKEYLPAIKAMVFGASDELTTEETDSPLPDSLKTSILDIGTIGENQLGADVSAEESGEENTEETISGDDSQDLVGLPIMSGEILDDTSADAGVTTDIEEESASDILGDLFGEEIGTTDDSASEDSTDLADGEIGNNEEVRDFESENFVSTSTTVYLRDEQIKSAGFENAYLEKESFDDLFFKTMDVSDLEDVEITKTVIRTQESLLAKVYIFKAGIQTNINEVYEVLSLRAGEGLGVQVNETNDFGIASFYLNDPKRSGTAFLTVRIGGMIYGFSYPKEYHSQIKNLIQLIEWEMG
ncbi:MAG: hypothetical protein AAB373_06310 [Patescibacteria group bacterium]